MAGVLLLAALAVWGCVPGDSDVFIHIDRPTPGETIGGFTSFAISHVRPSGYKHWNMAFDDESLDHARQKGLPEGGGWASWALSNGPHRMKVQMVARGWRSWEHSVDFIVDNPPQRLLRVDKSGSAGPGDVYEATLGFNLPQLRLEVEEFKMPGVPIFAIELLPRSPKTFTLRFAVPDNDDLQSLYLLTLSVTHPNGRELTLPVPVYLDL